MYALNKTQFAKTMKAFDMAGGQRHADIVEGKRAVPPRIARFASFIEKGTIPGKKNEAAFGPMIAVATGPLFEEQIKLFIGIDVIAEDGTKTLESA